MRLLWNINATKNIFFQFFFVECKTSDFSVAFSAYRKFEPENSIILLRCKVCNQVVIFFKSVNVIVHCMPFDKFIFYTIGSMLCSCSNWIALWWSNFNWQINVILCDFTVFYLWFINRNNYYLYLYFVMRMFGYSADLPDMVYSIFTPIIVLWIVMDFMNYA